MELVMGFYEQSAEALSEGANVEALIKMPVREAIGRFKYIPEENLDVEFTRVNNQLAVEIANAMSKEEY